MTHTWHFNYKKNFFYATAKPDRSRKRLKVGRHCNFCKHKLTTERDLNGPKCKPGMCCSAGQKKTKEHEKMEQRDLSCVFAYMYHHIRFSTK